MAEGLVGGEGFAIDAKHDRGGRSSPARGRNARPARPQGQPRVTEYLATLDDAALGAAPNEAPLNVKIAAPLRRFYHNHRQDSQGKNITNIGYLQWIATINIECMNRNVLGF
jgi:hypothetical protein